MPQSLSVGVIAKSATSWPVYVADQCGHFGRRGLQVDVVESRDPVTHFEWFAAGRYGIAHQNVDHALRAAARDLDVRILMRLMAPLYFLVAARGIGAYDDLRGKAVATQDLRKGHGRLMSRMLTSHALGPHDLELRVAGASHERARLLREGKADAGLVEPCTAALLLGEGFQLLDSTGPYCDEHVGPVAVARTEWLASNSTTAHDYAVSYQEALTWMLQEANAAAAVSILTTAIGIPHAVAERTHALIRDNYPDGVVTSQLTASELQSVVDDDPDLKTAWNRSDDLSLLISR